MAKAAKKAATKTAPETPKKAAVKTTEAPKKAATKTTEAPKKAAAKTAKKAAPKKAGGKANAAFMAPLTVSPKLAAVIGNEPTPRTQIIKKIWDYIKKNDLQDKENKRMINADEKLKDVFDGKDQVSMFELAKIVNNNVVK